MGRLSTSWSLVKSSWGVVKQDKELLWMPVLSFLASIIAVMSIAGIGLVVTPSTFTPEGEMDAVGMALAAAMYILLAFVAVYFHAATVAAAWERLEGGDPTVGSALRAANKRFGKLFAWSLVVATVNVILQAMRQSDNRFGRIAASFVGGAWNLATYFVVPFLMFTDEGVGGGLKGSLRTFKERWGETLVGHVGVGFAMGILTFVWVLLGLGLTFVLSMLGVVGLVVGIVVLVLGVIVISLIGTVLSAVYKTALYRYATKGDSGSTAFDASTLAGAAY